jgi:RNA polymerase sigma factor (sigma-70 family)
MIPTSMSVISPVLGAMSDSELMGAMSAGREEALDALFTRYARLVHRVATGILQDGVEAEDSTQEVFFEIYRKAHLYDPTRGSVRGWLLRYAYRRTVRRKIVLGRRAAYRGEPLEAAEQVRPHLPRMTRQECRWFLHAGLSQLTERQRLTLELTCFEDLTLRDVAERLGISLGRTRHYYYRGLARLQQWARVSDEARPLVARTSSRDGTTGGATDQGRRRRDPS